MLGTRARLLTAAAGLTVLLQLPAACGASSESELGEDDDQSTTASTMTSAQGGAGQGGGLSSGIGGNVNQGGANTCAEENYAGELVPLDILVLLDKSSSMSGTKWDSVVNALKTFSGDPTSAGVGIGLQLYPVPPTTPPPPPDPCDMGNQMQVFQCIAMGGLCINGICDIVTDEDSCEPADYADPILDIALLPGVKADFDQDLDEADPDGASTPSRPALEGAVQYATQWAQNNPTHVVAVVFATDGDPTGCSSNGVSDVASVASSAFNGSPSIRTYVVGVGDEVPNLDQVAQAGGTGSAFLVAAGQTQQFIDALNEVRQTTNCQFLIPEPEDGDPDFDKVNVNIVDAGDPNNNTELFNVGTGAQCDPVNGGWYYDDVNNPTTIILCPESCEDVQVSGRDVEVLLGCQTIVR